MQLVYSLIALLHKHYISITMHPMVMVTNASKNVPQVIMDCKCTWCIEIIAIDIEET